MAEDLPTKVCIHCGRSFAWRKKWASCWDQVRYCSDRCRRDRGRRREATIEPAIVELLATRAPSATICPSEAARIVADREGDPDAWRQWMEPIRNAARRLARQGYLRITSRGRELNPDEVRGAIRLGRGPSWSPAAQTGFSGADRSRCAARPKD